MEQARVFVYGEDAEGKKKRSSDWVKGKDGVYLEVKDRNGHLIRTTAEDIFAGYVKLQQYGETPT